MRSSNEKDNSIRESIVEGIFYPSEKDILEESINKLIGSQKRNDSNIFSIVTPHGGYNYIKDYLAASYGALKGKTFKNIVIIAPVHREPVEGILLPESTIYRTPLGDMNVDVDLLAELEATSPDIYPNDIPHLEEHCIEVQIPFIQVMFPQVKIVPLLIGQNSMKIAKVLTHALEVVFGDKVLETLFVVSANFSAYMEKDDGKVHAERAFSHIKEKDWRSLIDDFSKGKISMCCASGIAAVMGLHHEYDVEIIKEGNSSQANGEVERIVEYGSILFSRKG